MSHVMDIVRYHPEGCNRDNTPASNSCLVSFLLIRHPGALDRLKQEIKDILPNGERLTRTKLQKMSYLRGVLNESKY